MVKQHDVSDLWRVFFVEVAAPGFGDGKWLRDGTVTLKPGESMRETVTRLEKDECRKVRLVPSIAA